MARIYLEFNNSVSLLEESAILDNLKCPYISFQDEIHRLFKLMHGVLSVNCSSASDTST